MHVLFQTLRAFVRNGHSVCVPNRGAEGSLLTQLENFAH